MPIEKGEAFTQCDIFIDYAFEEVMFRWDHVGRSIHRKFYGEAEWHEPIPHDNNLFNQALLYGNEIASEDYMLGKPRRA